MRRRASVGAFQGVLVPLPAEPVLDALEETPPRRRGEPGDDGRHGVVLRERVVGDRRRLAVQGPVQNLRWVDPGDRTSP